MAEPFEEQLKEATTLLAEGKALEAAGIYLKIRRSYSEYCWHTPAAEGLLKCAPLLRKDQRVEAALLLPSALLYAKDYEGALEAGLKVPEGVGEREARAEMLYETGEAARILCRWDDALRVFERVAKETPDPKGVLALRAKREVAFCQEAKGDFEQARQTYRDIAADFEGNQQAKYMGYVQHRLSMIEKYHGRKPASARVRRVAHLPFSVHSLAVGVDGKVFAGGCWDAMLYAYDPRSRQLKALGRPVFDKDGYKIRALTTGPDGIIYGGTMGFYRAHLFAYDPSRSWKPGPAKDSNPRDLGEIPKGQVGVLAIAATEDGRVYASSIDDSYTLKTEPHPGAVFYWDPDQEKILRLGDDQLFPSEGMRFSYALCIGPQGRLYAGGGSNLFLVYDPALRRFSTRDLPTPGTQRGKSPVHERVSNVNSLTVGPDRLIYGGTMYDYHLFAYDPVKDLMRDLGRQVDQGLSSYHPGLGLGKDGRLYASTSWQFYEYRPKTGVAKILGVLDKAEGMVTFLATSPLGGAYAACYTSHLSKSPLERRVPSAIYHLLGK